MVLTVSRLDAYLLTKDHYLLDSPKVNKLVYIFDPSDPKQRDALLDEISGNIG